MPLTWLLLETLSPPFPIVKLAEEILILFKYIKPPAPPAPESLTPPEPPPPTINISHSVSFGKVIEYLLFIVFENLISKSGETIPPTSLIFNIWPGVYVVVYVLNWFEEQPSL